MPPRERIYGAEEARALREAATPGPWVVSEMRDEGAVADELGVIAPDDPRSAQKPDGTWHAAIVCRGMDGPTRAPNCTLLAAAPDLAATVEHLHARAEKAERAATDVDRMMSIVLGTVLDGSEDTPNCNEFRGTYRGREFAMIVQWADGKSPHELLAEARADLERTRADGAEAEAVRLRARVDELEAALSNWEDTQ